MSGFSRTLFLVVFGIFVGFVGVYANGDDSEAGGGLLLTVTSAADPGNNVCDATCTLREAITLANSAADSVIQFNIPGCASGCTISPATALPAISAAGMTIDGQTQPGFSGVPLIELDGTNVPASVSGLTVTGDNARIRGLVINDFTAWGIRLDSSSGSVIRGNYIGTDATGSAAEGNNFAGIIMTNGSSQNAIGGNSPAHRNIISGNGSQGVFMTQNSNNNQVVGNYIGTDVTGTMDVGNLTGVMAQNSTGNEIGGTGAGMGNLISGNNSSGIEASAGGDSLAIKGNLIGTDSTGSLALGNGTGVSLSSSGHVVGGPEAGARNVISGNNSNGVFVLGSDVTIKGNFIGTDATGMAAVPNGQNGISASSDGTGHVIGGTAASDRNVVSGNGNIGIQLQGSVADSLVQGKLHRRRGRWRYTPWERVPGVLLLCERRKSDRRRRAGCWEHHRL